MFEFFKQYLLNNLGWLGPVSDRARRWLGQETGHSPEILRSYFKQAKIIRIAIPALPMLEYSAVLSFSRNHLVAVILATGII
jgi:hypothetical protein